MTPRRRSRDLAPWPSTTAAARAQFRDDIVQAIMSEIGSIGDRRQITVIVDACAPNLFQRSPRVDISANSSLRLLDRLGERLAQACVSHAQLETAFAAASRSAQMGLTQLVSGLVDRDVLRQLREDLMLYLLDLQHRIATGYDQTQKLLAMDDAQVRAALSRSVFGPVELQRTDCDRLRNLTGISPRANLVVVRTVTSTLPGELRSEAVVRSHHSHLEVLVAASDGSPERLACLLQGQAVVSAPVTLVDAPSAVRLTRRAADLLRDRQVVDDRKIVPCVDLLGHLVVSGDPLLGNLLVQKHLAKLSTTPPARRYALGLMLAKALESGLPINQLARELGIPPQTAHSRMQALRVLFGDSLDDPNLRFEVMIALRAELPRWCEEA